MDVLLVTNAFLRGASFDHLLDQVLAAALRQGVRLIHKSNAELMQRMPDALPDRAIFWDKDVRLARLLEMRGVRLFNTAQAIADCDDKTLTYLKLSPKGIPMPDTVLAPMTFPAVGYTNLDFVDAAAARLGLPLVIKEGCGSFGEQVYLAHTLAEAKMIAAQKAGVPLLFQRFVAESAGRDVRVYVVGGKAVASILRQGPNGNFRSNVSGGGSATAHMLTQPEEALALSACTALGLDFGGVDLLQSNKGPLVCEVNSNAHFTALQKATGVNPADHILRMVREADV